jgi:r-opsin
MYFIGTTTIFLMVFISCERFWVIYKPFQVHKITAKTTIPVIILCSIGGVFWSITPVFGWSNYALEGALTSCSVEWLDKSFNVVSYNVGMFIFVYFAPLVLIFGSSIGLIVIVCLIFI